MACRAGAEQPAAELVGAPDDEGVGGDEEQHVGCQRGGREQCLERRGVDEQRGEGELEGDAPEQQGLLNAPTERSEARSVRAGKAVPIWPAIMPRKVIVVACG